MNMSDGNSAGTHNRDGGLFTSLVVQFNYTNLKIKSKSTSFDSSKSEDHIMIHPDLKTKRKSTSFDLSQIEDQLQVYIILFGFNQI